jgi:hypothetical protein
MTTLGAVVTTNLQALKAALPSIPRKAVLKTGVVSVVGSGFLVCSWTGGVLGLWSLFTGTTAGFLAGIFLADKFKE